jgi:hypothetical protein
VDIFWPDVKQENHKRGMALTYETETLLAEHASLGKETHIGDTPEPVWKLPFDIQDMG